MREEAAGALIERQASTELLEALRDPKIEVREAAAKGCSSLALADALPHLVAGMRNLGLKKGPLIPHAEDRLRPYGRKAVAALLTELPEDEAERARWIEALNQIVVNDQTAKMVLAAIQPAPSERVWLLEPILRSRSSVISERKIASLVKEYPVSRGLYNVDLKPCENLFTCVAESPYRRSIPVRSALKEALGKTDRLINLQSNLSGQARKCAEIALNAGIFTPDDLNEISEQARGHRLSMALQDLVEEGRAPGPRKPRRGHGQEGLEGAGSNALRRRRRRRRKRAAKSLSVGPSPQPSPVQRERA